MKEKWFKKIVSALVCIAMCAGLLMGCGSSGSGDAEEGSEEAAGDGDVQVVRILTQFGEAGKKAGLEALSAEVEKAHPEYKFEIVCLSYDKYVERLKQEMSAGDPPTIFTGRPTEFPEFVEAGQVMPLTDQAFINGFDELNVKEVTVDGETWSLPYDKEIYCVFYRKELLEEYNLEVPTTRDEWIKVCDTLKENGITPVAFGGSDTDPCNYTLEYMWDILLTASGNLDAREKIMSGESVKDMPEFKQMLIDGYELLVPYIEENDMSVNRDTSYEGFCSLNRAFTIHGNFCASVLRESAPDGDIGVMPFPVSENADENLIRYGTDDAMMIAANGNTEAGLAWMEYATTVEGLGIWADNSKSYSASKQVGEVKNPDSINVDINSYVDAGKYFYKGSIKYFNGTFSSEWQNIAQKFFYDGLAAYKAGTSAEEFANTFADEVDSRFSSLQ